MVCVRGWGIGKLINQWTAYLGKTVGEDEWAVAIGKVLVSDLLFSSARECGEKKWSTKVVRCTCGLDQGLGLSHI